MSENWKGQIPTRPIRHASLLQVATEEDLKRIHRFACTFLDLPLHRRGNRARVIYFGFRILYGVWCADGDPGHPLPSSSLNSKPYAEFIIHAWQQVMAFDSETLRARWLQMERAVRNTARGHRKDDRLREMVAALGMTVRPHSAPVEMPSETG